MKLNASEALLASPGENTIQMPRLAGTLVSLLATGKKSKFSCLKNDIRHNVLPMRVVQGILEAGRCRGRGLNAGLIGRNGILLIHFLDLMKFYEKLFKSPQNFIIYIFHI